MCTTRGRSDKGRHACYEEASWIDTWMNDLVNKPLGAKLDRPVTSCSIEVATTFISNSDGTHHTALLLPELVNAGVRLLVYAGDAGKWHIFACIPHDCSFRS